MKQLEDRTLACTHALTVELDPRSLKLNARKGETLLSCKGKGAYNAAKRAVSGEWKGYPVKLCVKYLGAQLQANGSLRAELQKRIGAARSGFARFSKLFKSRTVPVARKVLIFKAVVNEALLAALEVRPLGCSGCHTLERARGLLLRRLFGRQGFGAVAGDDRHESVTVESLRRRVQLSTVASELTVRRLMWLRASLLAEMRGQTRLELAALFGACDKLADAVDLRSGFRRKRPHVSCIFIFKDLSRVLPSFTGFKAHWKQDFLRVPVDRIQQLRTCTASESNSASVVAPDVAAEQVVEDVENHPAPEELQQLMCDICGDGPWKNTRALRGHKISKHGYRYAVQTRNLPHLSSGVHVEERSTKACQKTVVQKSCAESWSCRCGCRD